MREAARLMDSQDLDNRFAFHPATDDEKRAQHASARRGCGNLAAHLNDLLPEGREKSLAITKLEETMMWANAALAREDPVEPVENAVPAVGRGR